MRRISSSATLGLKLFLPTFWIVFFGVLTVAILMSGVGKSPIFGNWIFKGGVLLFFICGVLVLYFTLFQLKRVEIDHEYVYVTNYFKSYKYPYHNVEKIKEHNLLILHVAVIVLKQPGVFGKKIAFIESRQKFEDFLKSFPNLASKLVHDDDG